MPRRNSRHLTDPGIEKMAKAPKGKRIERFDSGADGLAIRITDRGKKTWCISYHFPDDSGRLKHHRYTIGPWPTIGVAQAREEARKMKEKVKAGIDPKAMRAAAKAKIQIEGRRTFCLVKRVLQVPPSVPPHAECLGIRQRRVSRSVRGLFA